MKEIAQIPGLFEINIIDDTIYLVYLLYFDENTETDKEELISLHLTLEGAKKELTKRLNKNYISCKITPVKIKK